MTVRTVRTASLPTVPLGGTAQTGNEKVEFKYDYEGRRIEKKVWEYDSGWSLTRHCKFLYDGWLPLLELDGADSDAVVRKYTWGRDLGGLQGRGTARGRAALSQAGGIGGLLAVYDADEDARWPVASAAGDSHLDDDSCPPPLKR